MHRLKRKVSDDRSYRCQICGIHKRSQQALNGHHRKRHDPQMCGICGKIFDLATSLTHHMYSHYERKYKCKKCEFHCHFESELTTHKITHHTTPQHRCMYPNCGRWFYRKGDLVVHVESHRKRMIKCKSCDFETKLQKYLNEHEKCHEKQLPYSCDKCGKRFKWRSGVKNHKKKEH